MVADRVTQLKPSPTLALTAMVARLKREGQDIISFGAGEPDFDTPAQIKEAAVAAIGAGYTKYSPTAGYADLREAISAKLARENGVEVSPDQVVVSNGAKQSVYNALQAVVNPGDEVILLAPYWMTYVEQVSLAGGTPVAAKATVEDDYVPKIEAIEAAVTSRTRAIVLNSPTNPTGAVFPREVIAAIADLAVRKGLWLISDEIYERHLYDGAEHVSPASLGDEVAARTVTINGVSKAFAMTGWRIGYAAAPLEIAKAMTTLQDQVTSGACTIAQKAAVEALSQPREVVDVMVREFACRRRLLLDLLSEAEGVVCPNPRGAFYLLADFSKALEGRMEDDLALAKRLLEGHRVACVPGSVFSAPGCLRLTYALGEDEIREGASRILEGLRSLT